MERLPRAKGQGAFNYLASEALSDHIFMLIGVTALNH